MVQITRKQFRGLNIYFIKLLFLYNENYEEVYTYTLLLLPLNAGSSRRLLPFDQEKRMKVNKGGRVEMAGNPSLIQTWGFVLLFFF